jgi:hypothetical protein
MTGAKAMTAVTGAMTADTLPVMMGGGDTVMVGVVERIQPG